MRKLNWPGAGRMVLRMGVVAACTLTAAAQDAARVQPGAYKVAFENDRMRVLEYTSRPGMGVCGQGMHSHPAHLTVVLTASRVRVRLPDGQSMEVSNREGDVFWSEAETHEVENLTGRNLRALLIELKDPVAARIASNGT